MPTPMGGSMKPVQSLEHTRGVGCARHQARTGSGGRSQAPKVRPLQEVDVAELPRLDMGEKELNRVLGGGSVPGGLSCWAASPASASPLRCSKSPWRWIFRCQGVDQRRGKRRTSQDAGNRLGPIGAVSFDLPRLRSRPCWMRCREKPALVVVIPFKPWTCRPRRCARVGGSNPRIRGRPDHLRQGLRHPALHGGSHHQGRILGRTQGPRAQDVVR